MTKIEDCQTHLEEEQILNGDSQLCHKTEYETAQKAAGGDFKAFEQIYWQHHRFVFNLCWKLTKNREEAEDITQNVFVKLHRKIGSFKGEGSFGSWLYRFTYNEVLSEFRKNKARKESTINADELPEDLVIPISKKINAASILDKIALKRAIAKLPAGYRTVLILAYIEGYQVNEVAKMLGHATGTTKSQLYKARKKVRELLFDCEK